MRGQCLCGEVKIELADITEINACHCSMCRRWGGGGPMMAIHAGPEIKLSGEASLKAYRSSDWAERAFCMHCGTSLYYKFLPAGLYFLSSGLFQEGPDFKLVEQIYIDRKPAHYSFANQTPCLTEAEVLAKYMGN
jgi:hypothetical protein